MTDKIQLLNKPEANMVEREKPMAAVPRYKASRSQLAHDAKKRELSTQPTYKIQFVIKKIGKAPTWLQRIMVVVDKKFESRIPENRPVRKLAFYVKKYDRSHLEK